MAEKNIFPNDAGSIGNRILAVIDLYTSKTEAATVAGVSALSLRRYVSEEQAPSFSVIANLAIPKGVSLEWVATGQGSMFGSAFKTEVQGDQFRPVARDTLDRSVDLSEFVFIPRYNLQASAGHGTPTDSENPIFTMAFRKYWIDNYLRIDPKDLSVISVKGDSMEGVLNDRDVILLNHADITPGAGLYVLRMNGELIVKRVQRMLGSTLRIISANEAYATFDVDLSNTHEDFAVIGKVVWFGRML